jgi:adhesin transport system outer membrane protein
MKLRIFFLSILFLALVLTVGTGVRASEKGEENPIEMSLSTAVLFALNNNPEILMAEERIHQMGAFADEARADYWPRIEFETKGGREYLAPVPDQTTNNYGSTAVRMSQKLYDGYATTSEVNRRESVKDSTVIEASMKRNEIIVDVVKYYLDVLMYQYQVQTLESYNAELGKIVGNIKNMYDSGAVSKVMNDYAMSRLAASHQDLSKAKASLNDSISNLEYLTGNLPNFIAYSPDNLTPEKYTFDYYYELAENTHLSVMLNQKEMETMKHKLNVEKAAYLPSVDFNMSAEEKYNDGGDTGRSSDVKAYFRMRYEIFDGFLKDNKTDRVNSQIKELEYKNQKITKELRRDLKLSYNQILAAQSSLEAVHSEIINNITVKLLNTQNFEQGTVNIIELIEGEERLKDSYFKKHKLVHDLYVGKYMLLINSALLGVDYFCTSCSNQFDKVFED